MNPIARRTFLKKSSSAGLTSMIGAWLFPECLFGRTGNEDQLPQKAICSVKREIYVALTQPRKAPVVTMTYIGRGFLREEFRSFIQSSDWFESLNKRTLS